QGKVEEAVKAFEILVSKYPQSPRARYGKAQCEDDLAEKMRSNEILQKAINTFEEVASLPDVPADLVKLSLKRQADRQQFLGHMRGSLVTLQKLVHLFPNDISLKNDLGVGYLLIGDNSNAKKVYEEEGLESGDPGTDDGRFYFHLGDALQRVGSKEAYRWYELGHQRGHFASVWQRSLYNVNGLKAQPWWTAKETGYTELVKVSVAAREGSTAPPLESLPSKAPDGASGAPVSPEASVASGTGGENSGVVEGELPSIYEEIEALGLYPVTQREDDPLPAGLDLSNLTPAPPSPCSLPLTAVSAPSSKGSLGSSICPAVGGTLLLAAEPTEATASAVRLGPEPHGLPLMGMWRPTSFPGGDPTEDVVATTSAVVLEPSITEGPLPCPQLPELDREGPFPSGLATAAQDPAFAPLQDSAPDPCLAPTLDPCLAPDVNPVPLPSTSRDIAAPGAIISSFLTGRGLCISQPRLTRGCYLPSAAPSEAGI
ncbi:Aspartyl/asparaginyl beta-hydroxylase, partial [Chelonia mydas]